MKKPSIELGFKWISIAAAIVLVIGCILLRFQIHWLDNYLFNQLLAAVSVPAKSPVLFEPALDAIFISIECILAIVVGYKLSVVPRCIACVQLYIVSMIVQALIYSSFGLYAHPLTALLTVALGSCSGYVLRRLKMREERSDTQYYELTLRNRELQDARMMLVKQDEVERRMLAADLHDQVLNDMKALKQSIESLELPAASSEKIQTLLQRSMSEVREVMDTLCPSALEHLGFLPQSKIVVGVRRNEAALKCISKTL